MPKKWIIIAAAVIVVIIAIVAGILINQAQQAEVARQVAQVNAELTKTAEAKAQAIIESTQVAATATSYARVNGPCGTKIVAEYANKVKAILSRWDDANKVANSTPRINLAAAITSLQSIKREIEALDTPACLTIVQTTYKNAMDYSVNGYLRFLNKDSNALIDAEFQKSTRDFSAARVGLERVVACAPDCQ